MGWGHTPLGGAPPTLRPQLKPPPTLLLLDVHLSLVAVRGALLGLLVYVVSLGKG